MKLPPLLFERSRPAQVVLALVFPAVYGALTGFALGFSEALYLVLGIAGLVGAVGAGFEHSGAGAGALRGIVAGMVFGGAILIVHELTGDEPERDLPDPPILLPVVTTLPAIAFAALGGWLRRRQEAKGAVESPHEIPGPMG